MSPRPADPDQLPPLPELYDLVYHWKDYASQGAHCAKLLRAEGVPAGGQVLEAACGTARYAAALATAGFRSAGFDLDPHMVDIARRRLHPDRVFRADLADFDATAHLDGPVHAIIALFGATGFLPTTAALGGFAASLRRSLVPGGVVVLEPWLQPADFQPGEAFMLTAETANLKVARQVVAVAGDGPTPSCVLEFHWMIARAGWGVQRALERVQMRLWRHATLCDALGAAGFQTRQLAQGYMPEGTLIIGTATGAPLVG